MTRSNCNNWTGDMCEAFYQTGVHDPLCCNARNQGPNPIPVPLRPKARVTYGVMPTLQHFRVLYEQMMARDYGTAPAGELRRKWYTISHGSPERLGREGTRPATGNYTCDELWAELNRLMKLPNAMDDLNGDEPVAWVCTILGTLGWEWV